MPKRKHKTEVLQEGPSKWVGIIDGQVVIEAVSKELCEEELENELALLQEEE